MAIARRAQRKRLLPRWRPTGRALSHYLGSEEAVLVSTRQHPFAIGGAFAATMRLLIPILLLSWGVRGVSLGGILLLPVAGVPLRRWLLLVIFMGACAVLARFAWRVLAWEVERVVITNEKVVHVHGVLNRKIASTPLVKIGDLTVSQPLLGRLLGYGALVVEGDTGDTPLHGLRYLPDPADTWRLVTQTARTQRAWEGGAQVSATEQNHVTPAAPVLATDLPVEEASEDGTTTVIRQIASGESPISD